MKEGEKKLNKNNLITNTQAAVTLILEENLRPRLSSVAGVTEPPQSLTLAWGNIVRCPSQGKGEGCSLSGHVSTYHGRT